MSNAERINVTTDVTGPNAPDQPIYEGFVENESETPAEGQVEQTADQSFEVPDKFMLEDGSVDVAALARSYQELERANSHTTQEQTPDEMPNDIRQEVMSSESLQRYTNEVQEHGDLTEDSYANFEAAGISRELVSEYVEGQKARAEMTRIETLAQVGGEEAYERMTEWALKELSDSEIDAYDSIMNTGDTNQINMAIRGLSARYQQANGAPNLVSGITGQSSGVNAFRSWAEVTSAMKDPRYQNDPAYQKDGQSRLSVSNF